MLNDLVCPITLDVMVDPVVASDGHTYERGAIEQWYQQNQGTSPMTRERLSPTLIPNRKLKELIARVFDLLPLEIDPDLLMLDNPEVIVGSGSFGKVVKGSLQTAGKQVRVAVKFLPQLNRQQQAQQLKKELNAHIAAQTGADGMSCSFTFQSVHSPADCLSLYDIGVCRLFGTCEKSNNLCIVMKLYRCNLRSYIDSQPTNKVPVGDVRKIASLLCMTLEQLHEVGVVVQDIKPENILLDNFNKPVFADFGISSVVSRTTSINPTSIKGTFNYMPPEAFDPPVNFKSDVWSMACVVIEMFTGVVPWHDMKMHQIMRAVADKRRHPDVPDGIPAAETIRRCFRFESVERPSASVIYD